MSRLIQFYQGEIPSHDGFTIDQVLTWNRQDWEYYHNTIQWLFPTKQQSVYNPEAPLLDQRSIDWFINCGSGKFIEAFSTWIKVYGLCCHGLYSISWEDDSQKVWVEKFNHNHLRITRIIQCLRYLQLESVARQLFGVLTSCKAPPTSTIYWHTALYGELP